MPHRRPCVVDGAKAGQREKSDTSILSWTPETRQLVKVKPCPKETLLYRGGVVSRSFVTDPSLSTIPVRRLARFSLLSEVGAGAAT